MPSPTFLPAAWLGRKTPGLAAVAATMVLAITSPSQAQDLAGVNVTPVAPTSVTISIAHLAIADVRKEVRSASTLVCRNSVTNHELYAMDLNWCANATRIRTMNKYRAALSRLDAAHVQRAEAPALVVAAISR
jgi:hypothetical protein